jgi:biopolymer transport protein ExbB
MGGIEIIAKGGWVMVPLGLLSTYALAVICYKLFHFYSSGVFNTRYIEPVMSYVKRGELTNAERILEGRMGPVPRIMKVAIMCVANRSMSLRSREAEIARVGSSELGLLESHLRGLELAANVGPLLGLLGTVTGMVAAFARLGEAGSRVDPAMLANGIWEALIATVGGLTVAIPAMGAYYILDGIIERVRATMKDVTVQILALEDEYIRNEKEQERRELMEQERLLREEKDRQRQELLEHEYRLRDERERERQELLEQERRLRELHEEQENAIKQFRTTAQASGTLRLLNPSYNKF